MNIIFIGLNKEMLWNGVGHESVAVFEEEEEEEQDIWFGSVMVTWELGEHKEIIGDWS